MHLVTMELKYLELMALKIPTEMEKEIEHLVFNEDLNALLVEPSNIGRTRRIDDAVGRYIVYAKDTFPLHLTLEGLRVVVDCANGGLLSRSSFNF